MSYGSLENNAQQEGMLLRAHSLDTPHGVLAPRGVTHQDHTLQDSARFRQPRGVHCSQLPALHRKL